MANEPTESERAADPLLLVDAYNGPIEFYRDDTEVTEQEYRRHADADGIAYWDEVLRAQVAE